MANNSTKLSIAGTEGESAIGFLDDWFDPIEAGLRDRVREFIQTMIESELEEVLARPRYVRRPKKDCENDGAGGVTGHRHGHRSRALLGVKARRRSSICVGERESLGRREARNCAGIKRPSPEPRGLARD